MPAVRLYAVVTSTGKRYPVLTLRADGTLIAENEDMADALPNFRRRGFSDRSIFDYTKRRGNGYVTYVEEIVEE